MKKKFAVLGLATILAFAGCGARLPEMTDEQAKAIGEYAAITLLKYDANNRSRLVDLSQVDTSEGVNAVAPEETAPPVQEPERTETPVIEIGDNTGAGASEESMSIEEFLELPDGMTINFVGVEVSQSYPSDGNDFFSLEAADGKNLLVLKFQISNQSGADQRVNLLERRDVYHITVDENYTRTALTTMLPNDMPTYAGNIPSGGNVEVVLLIEVDQGMGSNPSSLTLDLKNDSNKCFMTLL